MKIETIKRKAFGVSLIATPVLLFIGFSLHPHLFRMEPLETVEQLVGRFHNNPVYHIGHLIVTFTVPVIMIYVFGIMSLLQSKGKVYGFWGGIIALFGAFILAVDKGALCLVLSAFDTLSEVEFQQFAPFLRVVVEKDGLLWVVYLLSLLTIGAVIQTIGLLKEQFISKWQGALIIAGLLLLNNPDIDLISAVGALMMCAGLIPWGIRTLSGRMRCSSFTCRIYEKKDNKNFKCAKPCGL